MPRSERCFLPISAVESMRGRHPSRSRLRPRDSSAQQPLEVSLPVPPKLSIQDALNAGTAGDLIIEIADSGHYVETLTELSANGVAIELRAEDGRWPALTLTAAWELSGDDAGSITLNVSAHHRAKPAGHGRPPHATPAALHADAGTEHRRQRSLGYQRCAASGAGGDCSGHKSRIRGSASSARYASLQTSASGCGTASWTRVTRAPGPFPAPTRQRAGRAGCGGSKTAPSLAGWRRGALELASNTIFHSDSVHVERRQEGCVRFCWLPDGAVVPRQHKCVPRVEQDDKGKDIHVDPSAIYVTALWRHGALPVERSCADAIRRGADDESEMGVITICWSPAAKRTCAPACAIICDSDSMPEFSTNNKLRA